MKQFVPHALTLANLASGFLAIYFIFNNQPLIAVGLIALGFIFDMLDGLVARLLKVSGPLGVQLDSLADTVTFVVAPAFLVINNYFSSYLGLAVGIFIVACGVTRLAIFNITKSLDHFKGMSVPYFTAVVIAMVLVKISFGEIAMAIFFVLLALLMVSKIRFPSLKDKKYLKYKYSGVLLLALLSVMLLFNLDAFIMAVIINALFWVLLVLPFTYLAKSKIPIIIFDIGLIVVTIISISNPIHLIAGPIIYSALLSPLVEMSR